MIVKLAMSRNSGQWEERTDQFIEGHREEIIGGLLHILQGNRKKLKRYSRWGTWERDVLSRLPKPEAAQQLILERQSEVDAEEDEAGLIEDFIRQQLKKLGYHVEKDRVFVPSAVVMRWWNEAQNDRLTTTAVSRKVKQMIEEGTFSNLVGNRHNGWGRGFLWCGGEAKHDAKVRLDLQERLSDSLSSQT